MIATLARANMRARAIETAELRVRVRMGQNSLLTASHTSPRLPMQRADVRLNECGVQLSF